jgi:5-formyltetrahydrofolate cyclo-ligase
MYKQPIRAEFLLRRRAQDPTERQQRSQRVQECLLATVEFRIATSIALYSPVRGEVLTGLLAEEGRRLGKRLIYPRIRDGRLELVEVAAHEQLCPGPFGILEPSGDITVAIREVDLLVVPGVAFDRAGYRIGYGKGFYDRLLHGSGQACKAGIAFDFQLIAALPMEEHDVRMDLLATESSLLRWPRERSPHKKQL